MASTQTAGLPVGGTAFMVPSSIWYCLRAASICLILLAKELGSLSWSGTGPYSVAAFGIPSTVDLVPLGLMLSRSTAPRLIQRQSLVLPPPLIRFATEAGGIG